MAKKSSLKYLRPVSGEHSIQETVFTAYLSPDTPLKDPAGFSKLHVGRTKKIFPKFEPLLVAAVQANLQLETPNIAMEAPSVFGFSFEKYSADGELELRLRGENGPPPRPWLSVNILQYPGWNAALSFGQRWLRKVADQDRSLKITSLGLHYIDHLYWDSSDEPKIGSIFNWNSKFLPSRLGENVNGWNSKIAYNFQRDDYRQVDSIDVHVQLDQSTGHRRFVVNIPLRIDLPSPIPLRRFMYNTGLGGFKYLASRLHDDNKSYLMDILSRDVAKLIGLRK